MPREYLGCAWLVDYEVHGRGTELVRSVTSTYAEGATDDGSAGVTSRAGLLKELSAEDGSVSVKAFWLTPHVGNMREVIQGACFKSSTRLTKELLVANEENCTRVMYTSRSRYSG